jgi:plastocyanin
MMMMLLFWILMLFVFGGLALGVATLLTGRSPAVENLGDRLARGEVTAEDYRERLELLNTARRGSSKLRWVAGAVVAVGLLGLLLLGGAMDGPGMMGRMMDNSMMDQGMMRGMTGNSMMGGETRRIGPAPSPAAREVEVEGGELYFSPEEVRIGAGETVNLSFVNEGHMFHTLTVPEVGIDLRARPGDRVAAAFKAPEPGRYEFVCTVPGHEEAGVRGEIVVGEQ